MTFFKEMIRKNSSKRQNDDNGRASVPIWELFWKKRRNINESLWSKSPRINMKHSRILNGPILIHDAY